MIVLDTHVLIWWANGDHGQLSTDAMDAISTELQSGSILISSISAWEIAMLVRRQRLALSLDVAAWLAAIDEIEAVEFVPVDTEIGVKSVELPGDFHRDSADRLIIATARKFAVSMVTADEKIRAYPHVRTIW